MMELFSIEAPLSFCSPSGVVELATSAALDLMRRLEVIDAVPGRLPESLWQALEESPNGDAIEWRSTRHPKNVLGCTRYAAESGYLLLMREVSEKHLLLSRRLHRQRLEATGRLVASIAHELRNSVASIVYNADFLQAAGLDLTQRALQTTVHEIAAASRRLQLTVDGLLDYARLGPSISIAVSLRDVFNRTQGFLRPLYQAGAHRLELDLDADASWVSGNPLIVEQILINLLLNAAEASERPVTVRVTSERVSAEGPGLRPSNEVRVRVWDDGPGVPAELAESIFEPFFTTKDHGTGLGLPGAREAAETLGGRLVLDPVGPGACFSVYLPHSEERR
jgi:signal transduction histidine kinase